jgi:hypothetical protein
MRRPSLDPVTDSSEPLPVEQAPPLADDGDALWLQVARLSMLATFLNARLVAPEVPEA